ncbi:hypothetical protein GCM10009677_11680 [Sphaerisporangium rubeum]|uniref:tRNA U34 5-carboxymethylaminomethyl modifying GTPase MnmE/TrmE n=1 Tax=Sphaerisporangium rubeum TaxID=321317 RepID=A0A7X0IEI5_9ACTN|nr:dynamin family protein [Sphaerisporangium rubeum]MBB6472212.1 tRNA U34 5-carboxymethylaminomethyl modifying GTPase MnmE/TrmE [Sphaerisporangium rubeum]
MTAIQDGSGFDQFQGLRKELIELIERLEGVVRGAGQPTLAETVAELRGRVANDTFTVLVAGEFNAGKSTTINAMLGQKVLPASGNPTTAVLSVVRWGETEQGFLYRVDTTKIDGLDEAAVPVAVQDLTRHITIDSQSDGPNTWGMAEIRWPLELCRRGVDLVDSPGLNENIERARITLEFVNKADAVVFVFSALQAFSESEQKIMEEHLQMFCHDNIFFLVNRVNQVDEDDVENVKAGVRARIRERWDVGDDRLIFVNAQGALKGRQNGDPAQVEASGLPVFERSLEHFLTTQRARLKIVPPAAQVQTVVATTRDAIEDVLGLLDRNRKELADKYEQARGPLERLRQDRALIGRSMDNHLAATRAQIQEQARRRLIQAADLCLSWGHEVERSNKVTLNVFKAKENMNLLAEEMTEALGNRVRQYLDDWRKGELTDLIRARVEDLEAQVGEKLDMFDRDLEDIRVSIFEPAGIAEQRSPSALNRGLSTALGLFVDPGSALVGAQFGFKDMLKGVLPQLALAFGIGLLGFGPGVLFAALAGAGLIRTLWKLDKLNKSIVDTVADAVAKKLRDEAPEMARLISDKIYAEFAKQQRRVDEGLASAVAEVDEKVRFALGELERHEESSEQTKSELKAHRRTLVEIDQRAASVIKQWALS